MFLGAFMMPSHPPERGIREGMQWDLEQLALLDRLGFQEAWIGEHFTAPWEPCPAPDLLIARALACTERIKLCRQLAGAQFGFQLIEFTGSERQALKVDDGRLGDRLLLGGAQGLRTLQFFLQVVTGERI